ncbi:MAG TPA: cytochrome c [Candidatus Aquilonibacter sp.]
MERFARLSVALALIGVLVACAKSSEGTSTSSTAGASVEASASAEASESAPAAGAGAQNEVSASNGERIYNQNCASCHQTNGKGVPGTFPPLAGNPTVTGFDVHVIHIVKFGLTGRTTVDGTDYNGMMPAWSQSLSNADIASVITFIRQAWGNRARPVSEARVASVQRGLPLQPR